MVDWTYHKKIDQEEEVETDQNRQMDLDQEVVVVVQELYMVVI